MVEQSVTSDRGRYHPQAGNALMELIGALGKLGVPPDARETAILTVGAQFQAGYELYSHIPVVEKGGLLSKDQVEVLTKGGKPENLNEQCSIAFDVAKHLCSKPGPLPKQLWDKSVEVLSRDTTVGLVHYVGFYCYACVALNAIDAPVPE